MRLFLVNFVAALDDALMATFRATTCIAWWINWRNKSRQNGVLMDRILENREAFTS